MSVIAIGEAIQNSLQSTQSGFESLVSSVIFQSYGLLSLQTNWEKKLAHIRTDEVEAALDFKPESASKSAALQCKYQKKVTEKNSQTQSVETTLQSEQSAVTSNTQSQKAIY